MMTASITIGVLCRHAPYSSLVAQESLDAALAAAAYGQVVTLIFMDEGIWQLVKQQQVSGRKSLEKQLASIDLYDIAQVLVCARSLEIRGLTIDDLAIDVTLADTTTISDTLRQQIQLMSF